MNLDSTLDYLLCKNWNFAQVKEPTMALVVINFYPRINTALRTDVLSREKKLERNNLISSFFVILWSGVLVSSWSFLEEVAEVPSLKRLPLGKTWDVALLPLAIWTECMNCCSQKFRMVLFCPMYDCHSASVKLKPLFTFICFNFVLGLNTKIYQATK